MLQRMIKRSKRAGTVAAGVAATAAVVALAAPTVAWAQIRIGFMAELSRPAGAARPGSVRRADDGHRAQRRQARRRAGHGHPRGLQLKPEVAVQLVDKLIEQGQGVQIITGITFSNIMMAVNKKITDEEVFLIGCNAGPSPIAGAQCSPYYFSVSWQNDQQAEVVGKYAADKKLQEGRHHRAQLPGRQGLRRRLQALLRQGAGHRAVASPEHPGLLGRDRADRRRPSPDAIFTFLPGGLGINFVKQWAQSGLKDKIPLLSASTTDGIGLPAMGDAAAGVIAGTFWGPDFKNEAKPAVRRRSSRTSSSASRRSTPPSRYDAALLLDSAIAKVKGNVSRQARRSARRCKAADFKSVRGRLQVQQQPLPGPGPACLRGRQGRQGPDDAEDHRHAAKASRRTPIHEQVHDEVTAGASRPGRSRAGSCRDSLYHAGAQRPAARRAAVPARRRIDAGLRHHELREPRARFAVHDGRLLRGGGRRRQTGSFLLGALIAMPAPRCSASLVEQLALMRPLPARPPRPGAGDLRPDAVLQRTGPDDLGPVAGLHADARRALRHGRPVSASPIRPTGSRSSSSGWRSPWPLLADQPHPRSAC